MLPGGCGGGCDGGGGGGGGGDGGGGGCREDCDIANCGQYPMLYDLRSLMHTVLSAQIDDKTTVN